MKAAIQDLMDDHQLILRMLRAINGMRLSASKGRALPGADVAAVLDFIKTFADAYHHGKEEGVLFPALEEAGLPRDGGPVGVMLMEHDQGRRLVGAMAESKDFSRGAAEYAELLSGHISKEDMILYPMALDCLPEERWESIKDDCDRVEAERMGPARRDGYVKLVERLLAAYPAPELVRPAGRMCH